MAEDELSREVGIKEQKLSRFQLWEAILKGRADLRKCMMNGSKFRGYRDAARE